MSGRDGANAGGGGGPARIVEAPAAELGEDERWAAGLLGAVEPLAPSEIARRRVAAGIEARRARRAAGRRRRRVAAAVLLAAGAASAAVLVAGRGARRAGTASGGAAGGETGATASRPGAERVPALRAPGSEAPAAGAPPPAGAGPDDLGDLGPPPGAERAAPAATPGLRLPRFAWAAGFETGDLTEWTARRETYRSGTWSEPFTAQEIVTSPVRSGRFALKLTADTTNAASTTRIAFNFIEAGLPAEGHYAVWYHFPQRYRIPGFWTVWSFRGRRDANDPRTRYDNMWALLVQSRPDGEMVFHLHDRQRRKWWRQERPVTVPVGAWIHVECYFKRATHGTGRVVFWQDGVEIFDLRDLPTAPSDYHSWAVGSIARDVSPSPAVVHVDDVSVSEWRPGGAVP